MGSKRAPKGSVNSVRSVRQNLISVRERPHHAPYKQPSRGNLTYYSPLHSERGWGVRLHYPPTLTTTALPSKEKGPSRRTVSCRWMETALTQQSSRAKSTVRRLSTKDSSDKIRASTVTPWRTITLKSTAPRVFSEQTRSCPSNSYRALWDSTIR